MGTWGPLAFDNDTANDWAYDLEKTTDLSLVESALDDLESTGTLDPSVAEIALAACDPAWHSAVQDLRDRLGE